MKRLMKKVAGYEYNYDNVNKILDAMTFTGGTEGDNVNFEGTIPVETLKSQFGLTDSDLKTLPDGIQEGGVDFEDFTDGLFNDYVGLRDDNYKITDKDVNLGIQNNEFFIEGTAVLDSEGNEDMNGPDEFNQKDFI